MIFQKQTFIYEAHRNWIKLKLKLVQNRGLGLQFIWNAIIEKRFKCFSSFFGKSKAKSAN